ncbi:hypothetical protein GBF35_01920 [Nonomuraea phyllanthi]|uniref:hypothetical protein n=1 Tax=Nonomuraea phyllanthi TaxID=2219224 RepID=UPI001293F144|nr:hypothetical protein [Nonomuraea phyllanthi]QFY05602.1 hypothetical protein GBF35_01920 [Nonomuraea phyllanthi]
MTASIGGNEIAFHLPYRCAISPWDIDPDVSRSVDHVRMLLDPIDPPPISAAIRLNDESTVACNALSIDFIREGFNRTPGVFDPPIELAFNLVNNWIARLRVLMRAAHAHPLSPLKTVWRFKYLNDDETPLEPDPPFVRERYGVARTLQSIGLNLDGWNAIAKLPWGYDPAAVDVLLLDAQDSVDEIGPAIVLAATAVEVRIEYALNSLARLYGINPELWDWINTRNNDVRKQPGVNEQLDELLGAIARRSLKEDKDLWPRYQKLRKARNSFVHTGEALLDGKPLDGAGVAKLVQTAREVVDWIDELLPHAERRPQFDSSGIEMHAVIALHSPESE